MSAGPVSWDAMTPVFESGGTGNSLLLVGWDKDDIARYRDVLRQTGLISDYCEPEAAVKKITGHAYSIIIATYPMNGIHLDDWIDRLRSPSCPSRGAGLVVLANPETMEGVNKLVGRGVNKVLSRYDYPDVLGCLVSRLREGASPFARRKPTNVHVDVLAYGVWRNWLTHNVSHSGMLIVTEEPLPPGVRLRFRLRPDNGTDPINGEAVVVRVVDKKREGASGIGVRFCSFDGNGRQRMGAFVDSLRTH